MAAVAPDDEVLLVDEMADGGNQVSAVLSKFRRPGQLSPVDASTTEESLAGSPARFGRIPIVQRRKSGGLPRGASVPDLLARLLARF